MTTQMKPIRSFLFVPGNKPSWIEKVISSRADALILDLEDSVPHAFKAEAREIVKSKLAWLTEQNQRTWVRINRSPHLYDFDDILAVVSTHVEGIVISKPCGPEDIHTVSSMLSEAEYRNGVELGHTKVIPLLETARSLQYAYEIALCERVPAIVGATAKNADVARALKTVWSASVLGPVLRPPCVLHTRLPMRAGAAH